MKKSLVFVSCIAAMLIASHVSFAQEEFVDADPPADSAPCACCAAAAVAVPAPAPAPLPYPAAAPVPYGYPPYPYMPPRMFGYRRAARMMAMPPMPYGAPGMVPGAMPPYPMNPRMARRAARAAEYAPTYPIPMPNPDSMTAGTPGVNQPDGSAAVGTIGPQGQSGKWNISFQKAGTTGPVVNFLSLVRTHPNPYAGYAGYPMPVMQ